MLKKSGQNQIYLLLNCLDHCLICAILLPMTCIAEHTVYFERKETFYSSYYSAFSCIQEVFLNDKKVKNVLIFDYSG